MPTNVARLAAIVAETPSTNLLRQPWAPSLDLIAGRLLEHLEYSGRLGMRPTDIAKDCRFLLEIAVSARTGLTKEVIEEIAGGIGATLMSTDSTKWEPILRALVRGAYSRGYQAAKVEGG